MIALKKLAALFALLASEAWFLWNPKGWEFKWDALAACFTTLLALLLLERHDAQIGQSSPGVSTGATMPKAPHPNDITLFKEFLAALSPTETIDFLRNHDFGAAFRSGDIMPLHNFVREWKNPDKEFIDPTLETERKVLLDGAAKLANLIASKTAPIQPDIYSVKPRNLINQPIPDWVKKDAEDMNSAATNFVEIYDVFVRRCRAILPLIAPGI